MSAIELLSVLEKIEIIKKTILMLLYILVGLGGFSIIVNITRLSIIRVVLSMIFVVGAMITNTAVKFLTINSENYLISENILKIAIGLLGIQILITIFSMINIFKRKKY